MFLKFNIIGKAIYLTLTEGIILCCQMQAPGTSLGSEKSTYMLIILLFCEFLGFDYLRHLPFWPANWRKIEPY